MKVLIACEYSGIVRDCFSKNGHNSISCDLLPTESKGKHYQGNIFDIINNGNEERSRSKRIYKTLWINMGI